MANVALDVYGIAALRTTERWCVLCIVTAICHCYMLNLLIRRYSKFCRLCYCYLSWLWLNANGNFQKQWMWKGRLKYRVIAPQHTVVMSCHVDFWWTTTHTNAFHLAYARRKHLRVENLVNVRCHAKEKPLENKLNVGDIDFFFGQHHYLMSLRLCVQRCNWC